MKATYSLMVFILCLNLATYGTEKLGIFTGSNPITPFDAVTESGKFNGTLLIGVITHSQDPTGGTDYVSTGLGLLGGLFAGVVAGFPAYILAIPYMPAPVAWMIIALEAFVYAVFVLEFATGRDISGSGGN
jgi:energy-converting hydrogenase Eha subunit B